MEQGGTVSKEAFLTEAVVRMDQCREEGGPTGYKTVLHDSSVACSSMDRITRRLFVRKDEPLPPATSYTAFRCSGKICLKDGSSAFMTCFLSLMDSLTDGTPVTCAEAVATTEFSASLVMMAPRVPHEQFVIWF